MGEMRAAALQNDGSLKVMTVPTPRLLPRSCIVKILAVQMAPYTTDVVSGTAILSISLGRVVPLPIRWGKYHFRPPYVLVQPYRSSMAVRLDKCAVCSCFRRRMLISHRLSGRCLEVQSWRATSHPGMLRSRRDSQHSK